MKRSKNRLERRWPLTLRLQATRAMMGTFFQDSAAVSHFTPQDVGRVISLNAHFVFIYEHADSFFQN